MGIGNGRKSLRNFISDYIFQRLDEKIRRSIEVEEHFGDITESFFEREYLRICEKMLEKLIQEDKI